MFINSCCCFSLRTGTIVTGCLSLASTFCYLALVCIAINQHPPDFEDEGLRAIYTGKIIGYITATAVACLVSLLLLIGAVKRNMWLLLPWMVLIPIGIIVTVIKLIYSLVILANSDVEIDSNKLSIAIVTQLCIIGLNIFFALVVTSYFQTLREERKQGGTIYSATAPWTNSSNTQLTLAYEKQ